MQLSLCSVILRISTMLHIHYLMTCSEYVVLDYHTDIYLAMIAYGKCLRKLVYQKMEDSLPEIALSG